MIIKRISSALAFGFAAVLVVPVLASAASTTNVVTPTNSQGWVFIQESPTASGSGSFVNGPGTPPLGTGSVNLAVDSTRGEVIAKSAYQKTKFADITELEYSTYRTSGADALAVALQFDFDNNVTDGDNGFRGRVVYEPYHTQTVTTGAWQTWDTLNDAAGNGTGNWWLSDGTFAASSTCAQATPCTWNELKTEFPDGGVRDTTNPNVWLKAGGGWAGGFNGNVDALTVGVNGNINVYNFELNDPTVSTPVIGIPAHNSVVTTAELERIDWSDSTATYGPVSYQYRSYTDAGYTLLAYASGDLTESEIATTGTPEGIYYVQVRAKDSLGNFSEWSNSATNTHKITVDNTPVTPPAQVVATDKDQCKNDGYKNFVNAAGKSFKNQGACVSSVASNGKAGGTAANKDNDSSVVSAVSAAAASVVNSAKGLAKKFL